MAKGQQIMSQCLKTELIIFRPHAKKLGHPLKFKLNRKRLIPAHSVNI